MAWASPPAARAQPVSASQHYQLGAGDKIHIEVFGESDMEADATVNHQGMITYWLLGELKVGGLTVSQVQQMITDRLKGPYLLDPRVQVSVAEYRAFYVTGQVHKPSSYPYSPGLTVAQAILTAGGFTDRASRGRIYVHHEGNRSDQRTRVSLDDPVAPGDTVTVEESFF
jgi:protein involved in polysaccharide export with SLBB domain